MLEVSELADALKASERSLWIVIIASTLSLLVGGCGASLTQGNHLAAATQVGALKQTQVPRKAPAALGGNAAHEAAELAAVSNPASHAYKIGPMDVVDVSVFQVPELSKTVQVSADGTINLPLVGSVRAAGRTSGEVEHELTLKLGKKYLQSPQVNVYVKEFNSQRVTVDGAVKRPGVYPLHGPITLLQAIATAEGFTDTADSSVVIFRTKDGARSAAKFDVADIRAGNTQDPIIMQGDVVVVSNSTMKESYQALLKILPVSSLFVSIL